MALSEIDRNLLERCLQRKPGAWEDFVDRFMGLVFHVVNHTAQSRGLKLAPEDREDLAAEVLLAVVRDDFAVLRHFRGQSSLATYLAVIARRVVVRELLLRREPARMTLADAQASAPAAGHEAEERLANREAVERLLAQLNGEEAEVVRLYHIEGRTYREISSRIGVPENSVGPTLSRAREKLRRLEAAS